MSEAEYITVEDAAIRLEKSESQVRRDAKDRKLNSIKDGGRIWIRLDAKMRTMQEHPSAPRLLDPEELLPLRGDARSGASRLNAQDVELGLHAELIDQVECLQVEVARLTARVRRLEALPPA